MARAAVGRRLRDNREFHRSPTQQSRADMGNKIVTEADRKATPKEKAGKGFTNTAGHGQKVSLERGSHTRSKKNPGKRPRKGG